MAQNTNITDGEAATDTVAGAFTSQTAGATSSWSPLRSPLFRALWLASLASNTGTWMHETAAAWLMTGLAPSPFMVGLVQAATSLPVFLLALPAGAVADIVDRRRLLIAMQTWMLVGAATLGALTVAGLTGAWTLLAFTFLISVGAAVTAPAWQAITPELVTREDVPAAVALGGVSFNASRVVGPAVGGFLAGAAGPGAVFLLNAASFLGVVIVLYTWRRGGRESALPAERVFGAMRAGARYVLHAPEMRAILVRAAGYILFASALWALLPLLARQELRLDATGYGVLLGCLGAGAVAGGVLLPRVRKVVSADALIFAATIIVSAQLLTLAYVRQTALLYAAMVVGGVAWTSIMLSFNVATLRVAPEWVRSRAAAVFLLVMMGGQAAGSALWGAVATRVGIAMTLTYAAAGLAAGLLILWRYRLAGGEALDLTPSSYYPTPVVAAESNPEVGAVLVTIEYRIAAEQFREFEEAMDAVRLIRLRDGGKRWGLFHDLAEPGRYVETFMVESWAEHLRQHGRTTSTDREIEERALAYHRGNEPPRVSHLIAAHRSSR